MGLASFQRCSLDLTRWSNGTFKSALHQVVTRSGKHRYSTALFTEPNYDTLVEPLPSCCSADNPARCSPVSLRTKAPSCHLVVYQAVQSAEC